MHNAPHQREIKFADSRMCPLFDSWYGAIKITEMSPTKEGAFGCTIKGDHKNGGSISIFSVEHAQALIKALQSAIEQDFLFTNDELNTHYKSATDTRLQLRERVLKSKNKTK
jgi:hypothetical protein